MKKNVTKNFSRKELSCRCGCGLCNISTEALAKLQFFRDLWAKPIVINSACRCERHNREVGGANHSAHLATKPFELLQKQCSGFDVKSSPAEIDEMITCAREAGFKGIGIPTSRTWFHIDCRQREETWVYLNK